jgi:hypothetical protein
MKILKRKNNNLEGEFYWPSLKCRTKFKAKISGNNLEMEEYEVIKTEMDRIEVEVFHSSLIHSPTLILTLTLILFDS